MTFVISLLTKGLTYFLTRLLATLVSEKMIEYSFFKILEAIAQSTKTNVDDEWVAKIKELYQQKPKE